MEVDEIQRQVCKFQRVSSNGSTTTTDNNNNSSSNPQKLATSRGNSDLHNRVDDTGGGGGATGGAGGGVTRLCGWPSSRIVRVSRASGGKDRHSKVLTSKGLRDRRVRLSVGTAIQFYDLQDRLGFDQPSKAVEWLLKAASSSIDELPSLDIPVVGAFPDHRIHLQVSNEKKFVGDGNDLGDRMYQLQCNNNNNNYINFTQAKSPSCSSTSETSKGSGLSLSRSETRTKARERAREISVLKKDKEKEKEIDSTRVNVLNQVNSIPENSSFTDLLTGGINATTVRSPMEYFFNRPQQPSQQLFQIPQFNITNGDNLHHFSFDSFLPAVPPPTGGTGGGERQNINFLTPSPPPASVSGGGVVAPGGFTRGTLQSNLQSPLLGHHHHLQRFQSSSIDGSSSANLPFFIVPNATVNHFPTTGGYHLGYSGGGDQYKEKSKN